MLVRTRLISRNRDFAEIDSVAIVKSWRRGSVTEAVGRTTQGALLMWKKPISMNENTSRVIRVLSTP